MLRSYTYAYAKNSKKLYTVLKYEGAELVTADGKNKKATTGIVNRYVNKFGSSGKAVNDLYYQYDPWGNITKITDESVFAPDVTRDGDEEYIFEGELTGHAVSGTSSGTVNAPVKAPGRYYTYNALGEVEKAEETYVDGTASHFAYTYDEGGNILTETVNGTEVHTYTYDSVWKDKLISYDGKNITYDVFGCPTDYMGSVMTWDIYGGLTSVDNGTDTITYTYMGDGQRRSKTVNGVTTTYHYNNGMLLSETTGDETLRYYYDSTGKVASFTYKKRDEEEQSYFYTRNAQGDIIGVYRSKDSKLMGIYEYDLWGRPVSVNRAEDMVSDYILTRNPFRYRGYYYDSETGFYYLTARYYDPQIRRFISADSMNALMIATTDVTCKNLFVYAENNPVTNKDSSGGFVETAFDVISLAGSIVEVCCNPMDPWAWAGVIGDAADLIPCVTGVGEAVKAMKTIANAAEAADTISDAVRVADKASDTAKAIKKTKPDQIHHFATNKSKKYTSQFEEITKKYDLDLDDEWNKESMPHQGRHPNAYHDYVLDNMKKIDEVANGNREDFVELFDQLKQEIINNPDMLYKEYWMNNR